MKEKHKINIGIIGAGSIFSPEFIQLLIENQDVFQLIRIKFMDIDEERIRIVGSLCERLIKKNSAPIEIVYVHNYEDAITDVDFVLIQFRVGGAELRIQDELLGKKYKIPFVETVSVCGISTFLRTYYEIEKIANIIKTRACEAWVLNFTNPAGIIAESLSKLGVKNVIGVCNASTRLINYLKEKLNISSDGQFFMNWRGLNHLTIADRFILDGRDISDEIINNISDFESDKIPFTIEMIKQLGFIPNQYFQYYFRRNKMVEKLQKQEKVRSQIVLEIDKEILQEFKTIDYVPDNLKKRGGSGYSETVVNLLLSLITGDNKIHYLVTKNEGVIPELPPESFVEVPTLAIKNNVFPIACGRLPLPAKTLICAMKDCDTMLFNAVKSRSKKMLYNAILMHPLIATDCIAKELMNDIIKENQDYIPFS